MTKNLNTSLHSLEKTWDKIRERLAEKGSNSVKPELEIIGKIAINVLSGWFDDYGEDAFLSELMQRWSGPQRWVSQLEAIKTEFLKNASDSDKRYCPPRHWIKPSDIEIAIATIREDVPGVDSDWGFRDGTVFLGEYLELNLTEMMILDLACRISDDIEYDNRCILGKLNYLDGCKSPVALYARALSVTQQNVKEAMKGFLFNSGILTPASSPEGLFALSDDISECFGLPELNVETLDKMMFPSTLSTELAVNNYPHLSTEIAWSEKIINASLAESRIGTNLMLWGIPGAGKTELAVAMAKKNGWNLKVIGDISRTDMTEKSRAARLASLKVAMKLFARDPTAVLLFDEMEDLFKSDTNASFSKAFINRIIETTPVPIIWTTNDLEPLGRAVLRRMVYNIGFEIPPVAAREEMWRVCSARYGITLDEKLIEKFAVDFDIAPALIDNAMKIASLSSCSPEEIPAVVTSLDTLVRYGQKRQTSAITVSDTPYDITCANTDIDMAQLTNQLMAAKPQFSLCLYGRPGTGKSEYGRYLAKKLGKKVLFKRASDLMSKYVGEGEKLIAAAFAEARTSEKVLIIDEGDSFLRNREYAKNSWEITEVNEMLSQMETHNQPFIMTTNLMKDLDPAALRRFTFKLSFEFLDKEQARRLFFLYFGVEPPREIDTNDILAPGDYAVVKRRADIIGVTDAESLYAMLCEETKAKPQNRNKVGFSG